MRRFVTSAIAALSLGAVACSAPPTTPASAAAAAPTAAPTPAAAPQGPEVRPDPAGLVVFEGDDGSYGFTRGADGPVVLPAVYALAQGFDAESRLAPVVADGRWALIDAAGRVVWRPYVYDNGPDYVSEGLTRYVDDAGLVGFLDARGLAIIPARFTWAAPFEGGSARFCEGCSAAADGEHTRMVGGRWGSVSPSGELTYDAGTP